MRFSQRQHFNAKIYVTESVSKVNHVFSVFCAFLYPYFIIQENLEMDGQSGHSDGAVDHRNVDHRNVDHRNVDHSRGDDATVHNDDLEIKYETKTPYMHDCYKILRATCAIFLFLFLVFSEQVFSLNR